MAAANPFDDEFDGYASSDDEAPSRTQSAADALFPEDKEPVVVKKRKQNKTHRKEMAGHFLLITELQSDDEDDVEKQLTADSQVRRKQRKKTEWK